MKCICSLIFLLFSLHGISQKFTTSLDVQMSLPQGEYKTANPDAGLGGRFNFLYRPGKDVPVKIGLELGMQVKGSTSQYFAGYVYGFYEEFKVSASNNIFSPVIGFYHYSSIHFFYTGLLLIKCIPPVKDGKSFFIFQPGSCRVHHILYRGLMQ